MFKKCCKPKSKVDPTKQDQRSLHNLPPPTNYVKIVRCILWGFLILNTVWGITELVCVMILNFIANHPAGADGFGRVADRVYMHDILYIEHKTWELPENFKYYDLTPSDMEMLKVREAIMEGCWDDDRAVKKGRKAIYNDANCNLRGNEENKGNYFCEIVEKPALFFEAYHNLVAHWVSYAAIYCFTTPLMLIALLWRGQCCRIALAYAFLQIVPLGLSNYNIYLLKFEPKHKFALCGFNYLYNGFSISNYIICLVIVRTLLKVIEITAICWLAWVDSAEKTRRSFGVTPKQRNKVHHAPFVFGTEVLQPSGYGLDLSEGDETSSIQSVSSVFSTAGSEDMKDSLLGSRPQNKQQGETVKDDKNNGKNEKDAEVDKEKVKSRLDADKGQVRPSAEPASDSSLSEANALASVKDSLISIRKSAGNIDGKGVGASEVGK